MKLRTASAVLASAALAALTLASSPGAASAAAVRPAAAATAAAEGLIPLAGPFCARGGGDVCSEVWAPAGAPDLSEIAVQVWAWHSAFFGHFELDIPGAPAYNSHPDTTHPAGVTGYLWWVPNSDGHFTVRAWRNNPALQVNSVGAKGVTGITADPWTNIGTTGFDGSLG